MSDSLFPQRISKTFGFTVMITLLVITILLFIGIIPGPTWAAWLTLSLSVLIFMYYVHRFLSYIWYGAKDRLENLAFEAKTASRVVTDPNGLVEEADNMKKVAAAAMMPYIAEINRQKAENFEETGINELDYEKEARRDRGELSPVEYAKLTTAASNLYPEDSNNVNNGELTDLQKVLLATNNLSPGTVVDDLD